MFLLFSPLSIVSLVISGIYFLLLVKVFKSKEVFLNIGVLLIFIWLFFYFTKASFCIDALFYDLMLNSAVNFEIVIIAHIILVYALVKFFKSKNKQWLIGVLISLLLFYLTLPWYYQFKALFYKNIKYLETAAKLSIIPRQKGYIYLHGAYMLVAYKYPIRFELYKKAHKYLDYGTTIKTKGNSLPMKTKVWYFATFEYYIAGDFDKAIEIGDAAQNYFIVSQAYAMKNDYKRALEYIDKQIEYGKQENLGNIAWDYACKANILRNLNNEKEALIYYKKSIALVKYKDSIKRATEYYNNKNAIRDDWKKHRADFD